MHSVKTNFNAQCSPIKNAGSQAIADIAGLIALEILGF